jgi:hypothetical protein
MPSKLLVLQAGLYTIIAAFTHAVAALLSDVTLTPRYLTALTLSAIIAGATALKAFLSTTFSESGASGTNKTQT